MLIFNKSIGLSLVAFGRIIKSFKKIKYLTIYKEVRAGP